MPENLPPRINDAIMRMFVCTADENYMLARKASFMGLYTDFWWLSLHAVEKYLKAILLFDGYSAKEGNHKIGQIFNKTKQHGLLVLKEIIKPNIGVPNTNFFEDEFWKQMTVEQFIQRLEEMGNAGQRYLVGNTRYFHCDLHYVDALVWIIRRCCRPPVRTDSILWKDCLEQDTIYWKLGPNTPLENIMFSNNPAHAELRQALTYINGPFAEAENQEVSKFIFNTSIKNSPLSLRALELKEFKSSVAQEMLVWLLENVTLNKEIEKELRKLLEENSILAGDK
ncbi:MAG: hypothetical protein WAX89_00095 [Alphaproteobacteria bacterium]